MKTIITITTLVFFLQISVPLFGMKIIGKNIQKMHKITNLETYNKTLELLKSASDIKNTQIAKRMATELNSCLQDHKSSKKIYKQDTKLTIQLFAISMVANAGLSIMIPCCDETLGALTEICFMGTVWNIGRYYCHDSHKKWQKKEYKNIKELLSKSEY